MDSQTVREMLTGPVPSLRTPFSRDGSVDYDGLRSIIDFAIDAGAKTVLLTAGDSHYACLSDEEIVEVTRVTCEHTAGRAMVVAADRDHATARAIEFAKVMRDLGAAVVMCKPPDWSQSCTCETLAEHYAAVSRHMPVMIVTNIFIRRGPEFGLRTIEMTLDKAPNVVAIKDDMCGDFARRLGLLAHDRCALYSGGLKTNHMHMLPYGCTGYLSTFISFKPEVTHEYCEALEVNDLATIRRIIRDIEMPFFDLVRNGPGCYDAGIHATYEVFGLCKRWRRPPYYSLNDAEVERISDFFKERDLL